jgi:ectoine hydroxylase-related dioxygenase (phytanoyl-CoA dioxygenase family)
MTEPSIEGEEAVMDDVGTELLCSPDMLGPGDDGGAEARIRAQIEVLGLRGNVADLDERGYTVLTPAQVAPAGFAEKLRDLILTESERQTGVRPDMSGGESHRDFLTFLGRTQFMPDILFRDPAFEQAMMNPAVLALVTYLLGESCVMLAMNAVIKGPGPESVPFHIDTPEPAPLPPYATAVNATWLLTDYSAENGATLFAPGSHKLRRTPNRAESVDLSSAVPLEAAAGSVVIWHGHTWHAAAPRTAPGLRISLLTYFARYYMRTQRSDQVGHYSDRITQEMLDRNPDRFALLSGKRAISLADEHYCRGSQFA